MSDSTVMGMFSRARLSSDVLKSSEPHDYKKIECALYSLGFSDVFSESDSQSRPQRSCSMDQITLK